MAGNSWSFSQLVKLHGEERALELLATQTGFGDFGGPVRPQPKSDISDHCPLCGQKWSSRRSCGPLDQSVPPVVA